MMRRTAQYCASEAEVRHLQARPSARDVPLQQRAQHAGLLVDFLEHEGLKAGALGGLGLRA